MEDEYWYGIARAIAENPRLGITDIEQELARLLSWRSMATAPKDGTRILLLGDPNRYGVPIWIDKWSTDYDCWDYFGPASDVVGWMPLPLFEHLKRRK